MKNLLDATCSGWVRYDDYEWRTAEDGTPYLTPTRTARPILYDPLAECRRIVPDAVNIGLMARDGRPDAEIRREIRRFAVRYGLLGLLTALPSAPDFVGRETVYLPENNFVRADSMSADSYLALFFPFAGAGIRRPLPDAAQVPFAPDVPSAVRMSFRREYAERYEWLRRQFADWASVCLDCSRLREDPDAMGGETREAVRRSMALSCHMSIADRPAIVWDLHSLAAGIQAMLGFMLADDVNPLRLCRHCGRAFVGSRPSAAFCSPQCKNRHNVYKSRARKTALRERAASAGGSPVAEAEGHDSGVPAHIGKPEVWLKSVSAFANGAGGKLFFGLDDDGNVIGLADAQADAEAISRLIKERIAPYPDFILAPEQENGRNVLVLSVSPGRSTPYYYKADGVSEAYVRIGNESVIAPSYVLNQLLLKGMNRTYDALISEYDFKDYSFTKLRERYMAWTGNSMEEKLLDSFGLRDGHGKLTNAGALLADASPIRHSRLFCTRWNGLDKSGGMVDALDGAEYSGSLIILLDEGMGFVRRNMKTRWKKTADSRIEMPDYCERSVFESLVNALIHRDYLILGSEVHIDIFDDRLTVWSPGGMADGTRIQDRDVSEISSTRRNPVLADVFGRLGYMERQGSGFRKITEAYRSARNYRDGLEPRFYSDAVSFRVTLYNLNYGQTADEADYADEKQASGTENRPSRIERQVYKNGKTGLRDRKQAFEDLLAGSAARVSTRENMLNLFRRFGFHISFSRADVMEVTGITATPATELMRKMKDAKLIESAEGRGKYRFSDSGE